MKPKTYRDVTRKFVDETMEDSALAFDPNRRRDYILCVIAEMLATIADILIGNYVELKDRKTTQDTMQDHIQ